MKKTLFLFLLLASMKNDLNAQRFMQGAGVTISALFGTITSPGSSETFALRQTNFTYFPRYNFVENENSSISLGIPIGIGIGIASNTSGSDAGIAFAYDLPVVVDYNFGCKATSEIDKNFGGYLGVGFGYYKVNISKSSYSDYTGATYGPMLRTGVRIGSSNESWNGHAMTIGIFYKKGMEKDKLNTVGFNVLYDF